MYTPYIVEGQERHDLFARMLKDRVVFLNSAINDEVAGSIVAQLLYLDSVGDDEICLYINSPGGSITSLFAILDTMNFIKSDVRTVCIGQAASAAAVILACGQKRDILPNARVLIHQPLGQASGQASDIEITYKEIQRLKEHLNQILAEQTGQTLAQIEEWTDRDTIFEAEQALQYRFVDRIVQSKKKPAISKTEVQDF